MTGTIKQRGFQFERGFGFVEADGVDYFLHANSCNFAWTEQIIGAVVDFDAVTGQKGFAATNVRLVNV